MYNFRSEILKTIVKKIPKVELSYEEKVDKKVHSDLCFALPYGIKSLFWFTYVEGEYLCISIPLNGTRVLLNDAKIETCCFNDALCYGNGTLCLGTKINKTNVVVVYDIFYYKNIQYFSDDHYSKKLQILQMLLSDISNNVVISQQLTFFLPQFANNFTQLYEKTRHNNFTIYCCMFVDLYVKRNTQGNVFKSYLFNNKNNVYEKIFYLKQSNNLLFDMYDLYIYSKEGLKYYDKAHVNTLQMSYSLNKHFNNYSYIDNLDYIEESEDEEETCCIDDNNSNNGVKNANKTIDKNGIYVKCFYNKYLKLWEPNELIYNKPKHLKIATLKELKHIY